MAEDIGSVEADGDTRTAPAPASVTASVAAGMFRHDLLSRVKTQLVALRGQVGRLNRALANGEQSRAAAIERLDQAEVLRRRSASVGLVSDHNRRASELAEHVYSMRVNDDHLHALVEANLLHPSDVGNRSHVAEALRKAMDLWSGRESARRPFRSDRAPGLGARHVQTPRSAAKTDGASEALGGDNVIAFRPARVAVPAASTPRRQDAGTAEKPGFGARAPLCSGAPSGPVFGKRRRLQAPTRQDAQRVDGECQPD